MKPASYLNNSFVVISCLIICGCAKPKTASGVEENRYAATDVLMKDISGNLADYRKIKTIDHARLAEQEGVYMPPCVVIMYSDGAINTALMKLNPRVGLDLPQKILVFEEAGNTACTYPSSSFLGTRHGLTNQAALEQYEDALIDGLRGIDRKLISPVGGVTPDYGIVEIISDYSFSESIARLKEAVMKQGDTVWFGEIDLKAEAAALGEKLPDATLLLFGGPNPGGVAMAQFPKLGLDAFCQKLLVYEDESGAIKVLYNDIVAMAKLHYGTSAKPHEVIKGRLTSTFKSAVVRAEQ